MIAQLPLELKLLSQVPLTDADVERLSEYFPQTRLIKLISQV